jgi:hypothetical protein
MSVSSNCSGVSINFRGEEVDLSDALDSLFRELQSNLNNSQCSIRSLAMCDERNENFLEAAGYHFQIEDYVETLLSLFKELRQVSKDALGRPPPEYKKEYAEMVEKRKMEKSFNKLKIDDIKE